MQSSVVGNKGKNDAKNMNIMTTRQQLTIRSLLFHTTLDEKTMAICIIFLQLQCIRRTQKKPR